MKHAQKRFSPLALATAVTGITAALSAPAVFAEKDFLESIKDTKSSLSLRFRHEEVSQDGVIDAGATTLLTRLNLTTGAYNGFSGFVELDHVGEIQDVDYNNTTPNGRAGAAVIADPDGADLNQAFIQYKTDGAVYKVGRQRILLDNQRFVGGVGWRQNEQTYDAVSATFTPSKELSIFSAYVKNVNRIFGDANPIGDHANETLLLNAAYKTSIGKLTGYAYLIDNENVERFSTSTYGVRFTGKQGMFGYTGEYATQSDYKDSPLDYSASYLNLEGSVKFENITLKLGHELMGSDGANGEFITPLATLHKFQGWADKFLGAGGTGNIAGGIADTYLSVGTKIGGVNASLIYHDFSSDDEAASGNSSDSLGSEIGFVLKGKAGPVGLLLKYANYIADEDTVNLQNNTAINTDTKKIWLQAAIKI